MLYEVMLYYVQEILINLVQTKSKEVFKLSRGAFVKSIFSSFQTDASAQRHRSCPTLLQIAKLR